MSWFPALCYWLGAIPMMYGDLTFLQGTAIVGKVIAFVEMAVGAVILLLTYARSRKIRALQVAFPTAKAIGELEKNADRTQRDLPCDVLRVCRPQTLDGVERPGPHIVVAGQTTCLVVREVPLDFGIFRSRLVSIRRSPMEHASSFVPWVILVDSGKGDLPLVTDADFRHPASARYELLFPCMLFHSPLLARRRAPAPAVGNMSRFQSI